MIVLLLIFLGAYLLGSIPFGLLVAKSQGVDIRNVGSKNIGATNVWRVMGRKWGLLTFFSDFLKGLVAVLAAKWLGWQGLETTFSANGAGIVAAVGVILGHNFPVWLKFKGGKGVATSLGVVFGLVPLAAALGFALWGLLFYTTRYVSIASIFAAISVPVFAFFYPGDPALIGISAVAAGLIVLRHKTNIQRLLNGTENRFTPKAKS
ncbi:MAG: glycerol-3-phosphate 1-O-acyltransferase PlsY [Chthoniobacteraceae bacterium]